MDKVQQLLIDDFWQATDDMLSRLEAIRHLLPLGEFVPTFLEALADNIDSQYVRDFASTVNEEVQWFSKDGEA